MPPKRDAGAQTQPPVKMIRIGPDAQGFGCDTVEDKYRMAEESSYSPFPNNEQDNIDFDEENVSSPGIRTDTISLLMKVEQLQAQLKYERRCRILAERELRELKEMNALMMQMRHTAHELRVTLDHVLQGGEAAVAPQGSQDETLSFLAEPEAEMRAVHDIPEGRRSTFTGEDCHKPQLPPEILRSVIDHVAVKFAVDGSQIKTAIRTKLNNEDKLLKKRLGLGKAEHKAVIEQSLCPDASLLPENGAMRSDSQL
ncbi:uncharacterized protein LOC117812335 isoform X2 [Notolabrus celidotus]|uniref:uncharacterized protein LOC117812335 isoform X2 n=1 Tax=Notolabrus celidotus TaxID=1203425 RepID=UPI00148FE083|nr:uncharacterized protein LOC117812335 isoform X2 [Notolabrus celidotus]